MKQYNPNEIEPRWQKEWAKSGIYKTQEDSIKPKCYVLDTFPYPSGEGLHVGHPKGYIGSDIYARYKKMTGHNILRPMGWDAFGLPAENYALKNKMHPRIAVEKNIRRFKKQIEKIGFSYDWEREINTTDPAYYKWTQWIFLQCFKKGLAYESNEPINWCPSCKTGLALEDLDGGKCERCGSDVEQKPLRQWVLKIREYADRLLADVEKLNWPESVKEAQRNWIGRSHGAEIEFPLVASASQNNAERTQKNAEFQIPRSSASSPRQSATLTAVKVFTTRPDTLFGATYLVLSPEYPLIKNLESGILNLEEVKNYQELARKKTDIERTAHEKEKTGVKLKGVKAVNPATKEEIPIFIADYVLAHYGTGAIMAVPAHDERDFRFAQKFSLPIKMVVCPDAPKPICKVLDEAYLGGGRLVGSGEFDGLSSEEAKWKIADKFGKRRVDYKLRDWVFSRQRYWGEPIPLVFCEHCAAQTHAEQDAEQRRKLNENSNSKSYKLKAKSSQFSAGELLNPGWIAVPEEDLPVKLPEIKSYEPTGTGESPLTNIAEWVNVKCPKCEGIGRRETNTMPQWAGSSWYYLRYIDNKNDREIFDKKKEKYWSPVDLYIIGAEHVTRHLIYARFWHKFLFDIDVVAYDEPFTRLRNQGLIAGEDGRKMSKRWGNVINPDDVIAQFGADTFRIYEMFMGPLEDAIAWSTDAIVGPRRFLEKVWRLQDKIKNQKSKIKTETQNSKIEKILHKTIKKVSVDIENLKFNTAVSALMIFVNELEKDKEISADAYKSLLILLSPFAPHIAEELWHEIGERNFIYETSWPVHDERKSADEEMTIVVQVDGKVRDFLSVSAETSEDAIKKEALARERVARVLSGKEIEKMIYVPGRLVSIVTNQS